MSCRLGVATLQPLWSETGFISSNPLASFTPDAPSGPSFLQASVVYCSRRRFFYYFFFFCRCQLVFLTSSIPLKVAFRALLFPAVKPTAATFTTRLPSLHIWTMFVSALVAASPAAAQPCAAERASVSFSNITGKRQRDFFFLQMVVGEKRKERGKRKSEEKKKDAQGCFDRHFNIYYFGSGETRRVSGIN